MLLGPFLLPSCLASNTAPLQKFRQLALFVLHWVLTTREPILGVPISHYFSGLLLSLVIS